MRALPGSCAAALLCLIGCGSGSARTQPTEPASPPPVASTDGAEQAPPPPPPPPARVRLIHASHDPAAASVSLAVEGNDEVVSALAYRAGSGYVEVPSGHRALVVRGAPSAEAGSAPVLAQVEQELQPNGSHTAILVSQQVADAPFALFVSPDSDASASSDQARIRFFHAAQGLDDIDVCLAGATPREPASPVFAAVRRYAFGQSSGMQFAEIPAGREVALQMRDDGQPPCRGRVLGVARFTPSAGATHTLVAIARPAARGSGERELLVCSDAPGDGTCSAVPIRAR